MSRRPLAAALTVSVAALALVAFAPPRGGCGSAYTVVRGDTLSAIARRCRSSVADIAAASGVRNPDLIRVGQRLSIPGTVAPALAERPRLRASAASYAMARGDTLFSLARWANVSLASLMAANPGIEPHRIEIGDRIRLPAGARDPLALRSRERGGAPTPRTAARRPAEPSPPPREAASPRQEANEERDTIGM